MLKTIIAIATLVWPPIAAWLILKLFPQSLSHFVTREIDRRSDAKLEQLKADLQGAYSTLKTSVDILSASNSGLRPHIVEATSALWQNMIEMRTAVGGIAAFDSVSLASEAEEVFSAGKHEGLAAFLHNFRDEVYNNELLLQYNEMQLDKHRLFVGDRLWLVFYVYRAVTTRSALLISDSFKNKVFKDWRKDHGIEQLLMTVLPQGIVEVAKGSSFGGLGAVLSQLEGEFLHEAARVMSGSKALADSLADVQAMMLLQNAKVAQQTSAR